MCCSFTAPLVWQGLAQESWGEKLSKPKKVKEEKYLIKSVTYVNSKK